MDIGAHCAIPACHQQDFLPFTCDCCDGVFCLDHRSYSAHKCPKAGQQDRRVLKCPLCQTLIPFTMEQDANLVWSQHDADTQCSFRASSAFQNSKANGHDHHNKNQKPKKPRCAATNCNEKLGPSNTFTCSSCHQRVCLKHRFEADHDCQQVRQRQRQQRYGGPFNTSSVSASASTAASSLASTAAAARNRMNGALNRLTTTTHRPNKSTTTGGEPCPFCNQRFQNLIQHVNQAHPDPSRSAGQPTALANANAAASTSGRSYPPPPQPPQQPPSSSTGREICPQCHVAFRDVMELVHHVETAHSTHAITTAAGTSRSSSRANQDDKCQLM